MARRAAAAAPVVTGVSWTRNGVTIGDVPVPRGANDVHFEITATAIRRPRLQFTRDGEPLGTAILGPPNANDLEIRWPRGRGLPVILFTKNGLLLRALYLAPADADDLHLVWSGRTIRSATWTRGGELLQPPVPVPQGANDAHFHLIWR